MQILTTLTLIYAAVLVAALAVSLIAIWLYLRRTGNALAEAASALDEVKEKSAELASRLSDVEVRQEAFDRFGEAERSMEEAEAILGRISGRSREKRAAG